MLHHKEFSPKAVIFDLDGTLLDTLHDLADAVNTVVTARGYPGADYAEYRRRVGWGLRELIRRSLPEDESKDTAIVEAVAEEFRGVHFGDPVIKTKPFPGIAELVGDLALRGIPLFVHTNKPDAIARIVVEKALLPEITAVETNPFRGVLGQREDIPRKPDRAGVDVLLDGTVASGDGCWYIGDSEIDIETAQAAGCVSVGVTWGFRDVETLRSAGADHICYSIEELRDLLGCELA